MRKRTVTVGIGLLVLCVFILLRFTEQYNAGQDVQRMRREQVKMPQALQENLKLEQEARSLAETALRRAQENLKVEEARSVAETALQRAQENLKLEQEARSVAETALRRAQANLKLEQEARSVAETTLRKAQENSKKSITGTPGNASAVADKRPLQQSASSSVNTLNVSAADHNSNDPKQGDLYMVLMIMSKYDDMWRKAMRSTWLQYSSVYHPLRSPKGTARHWFVLGIPTGEKIHRAALELENQTYGDIFFADSDNGADGPKYVQFMRWIESRGFNYEYFVKVDTDTFLRPGELERVLRLKPPETRHPMYWGRGWKGPIGPHMYGMTCKDVPVTMNFFQTGQLVVMSRQIAQFVANDPRSRFSECGFREDVRQGIWVSDYENTTGIKVNRDTTDFQLVVDLSPKKPFEKEFMERAISMHLGTFKHLAANVYPWLYNHWPETGQIPTMPWDELYELTNMMTCEISPPLYYCE